MLQHHAIPPSALAVAILALIPFPALLILIWAAPAEAARAWFIPAFLTYAAAVLALTGGAHWALAAGPYGRSRIAAEWRTGFACLLTAWASLNLPAHLGITLLVAAFFLMALRDVRLAERAELPSWFAALRSYVAATAIVTAILSLIRILS